ncbi:MAG: hypothetical protein OXC30_06380 [Alphaproteobacteria bacterium]|nr:hypothetical protein [Alphaproteobacteria bacterium]
MIKKVLIAGILSLSALSAAPLIHAMKKTTGQVAFNVGLGGRYSVLKVKVDSTISQQFTSAYNVGRESAPLFDAVGLARVNNVAILDTIYRGVCRLDQGGAGGIVDTTEDQYIDTLFGAAGAANNVRDHSAHIAAKEYTADADRMDSLDLSRFVLDATAGISYMVNDKMHVWIRGSYSFGGQLGQKANAGLVKGDYSLTSNKTEEFDAASGAHKVKADLMYLTYKPFNDRLVKETELMTTVEESFSVVVGACYMPTEHFSIEAGLGVRRYAVDATWEKGVYSYPHAINALNDAYHSENGVTKFAAKYDKKVTISENFWPLVLTLGASYIHGSHHIQFGLSYASFEGALTNKEAKAEDSSSATASFAGSKRVQASPVAAPVAGNFRAPNAVQHWTMGRIDSMNVLYKAKVSVTDFSIHLGYVLHV